MAKHWDSFLSYCTWLSIREGHMVKLVVNQSMLLHKKGAKCLDIDRYLSWAVKPLQLPNIQTHIPNKCSYILETMKRLKFLHYHHQSIIPSHLHCISEISMCHHFSPYLMTLTLTLIYPRYSSLNPSLTQTPTLQTSSAPRFNIMGAMYSLLNLIQNPLKLLKTQTHWTKASHQVGACVSSQIQIQCWRRQLSSSC